MTVAARSLRLSRARGWTLLHVAPAYWLGGIVATSFIVRALAGLLRATPFYFPDEYIYAELGRSFAEHGRPLIRGTGAHFPAILQPLLTAPAWLVGDVEVSFHVIQVINALAMSLAALPVYWLARRLGLRSGVALVLAALTLAVPDLLYSSWVMASAYSYPATLAAVAAGTAALAAPTRRNQLAFICFAGLATLARVQFVVLPVCFVLATAIVGLRERRFRRAVTEQWPVLALFALAALVVLAAGPKAALGYYENVLNLDLSPLAIGKWMAADAMLTAYSSGWVLVPGAVLGLALAVARPRSRVELSFGALAWLVAAAVLFQAALYAANGAERIQERYFFGALPLVFVGFGLFASRGWPHRLVHAAIAAALVLVAVRVPLAGFAAADGKSNSPLLLALGKLETIIGDRGLASLLVGIGAGLLGVVSAAVVLRNRRAFPVLTVLAAVTCALGYGGAVAFDHTLAAEIRERVVPGSPSFVDAAGLGSVALVHSPYGDRGYATEELFWNRSVDRLLLLPQAVAPDAFAADRVVIGPDGSLLADGRVVRRPLLVEAFGATTHFRGARQVGRTPLYRLLVPEGTPRLALYMPGRYFDGWLALSGSIQLWPAQAGGSVTGRLTFALKLPSTADPLHVTFRLPTGPRVISLQPGERVPVAFGVCADGPWRADFTSSFTQGMIGTRFVSVRSTEPVFKPDSRACN